MLSEPSDTVAVAAFDQSALPKLLVARTWNQYCVPLLNPVAV